jgi:Transposase C of IS166 homeodomain
MTLAERAAALIQAETVALLEQNADLQRQMEWFKRQLFGRKSERQLLTADARQLPLAGLLPAPADAADAPPPCGRERYNLSAAVPPARRRSAR